MPEDFNAWISKYREAQPGGDWPDAAIEEVREVLDSNDTGQTQIPLKDMRARLRVAHNITCGESSFRTAIRNLFGRESWTGRAKPGESDSVKSGTKEASWGGEALYDVPTRTKADREKYDAAMPRCSRQCAI